MTESIYAPPTADIEIEEANDGRYYVVGPGKFLLLTIVTANMYSLYWYYRQWRAIRTRDASDIWPVARAIFAIFFTHSLFQDFDEALRRKGLPHDWTPMLSASLVVGYFVFVAVLSVLSNTGAPAPMADALSILVTPVLAFLMLPAQRSANAASGDAAGDSNRRLTGANWVWLIIGGLIWLPSLFGLYLLIMHPELFAQS